MFPHQQMAASLLPVQASCSFFSCFWNSDNLTCYNTCYGYSCLGAVTCAHTPHGCPGDTTMVFFRPAQVQPGDPLEQLQALRKQLEVALAGVEGQLEALRKQREAGEK